MPYPNDYQFQELFPEDNLYPGDEENFVQDFPNFPIQESVPAVNRGRYYSFPRRTIRR
jgi:hypothetical protein